MNGSVRTWGLPGPFEHRLVTPEAAAEVALPRGDSWLAHGNSRSYGDVALNTGHTLVRTRWLDRYVSFDAETGILECESGVLLSTIVEDFGARGWSLPVVPGTSYVTVGGAIANDVHGKNHHACGSFGDHVESLRLLRTDGAVVECSPRENADWFAATIGGLGLTGLVTHARLRLRRVSSGWIEVYATRFRGLDAFFELNAQAEARHEYTVSWIDCLSGAKGLRGVLLAGDHASRGPQPADPLFPPRPRRISFPVTPPVSLVNPLSLRLFNAAYYLKAPKAATFLQQGWDYFWPLDKISHWNRMYGRRGLLQYQFVVPPAAARDAISEVLGLLRAEGTGSFLAVLKTFGDRPAPGLLSFSRPGLTLALDFPNVPRVRGLFARLDTCIQQAGGALYPAKDALGSSALFHAAYPRWAEFQAYRDPGVSSTFLRRMEDTQ
ncbi:MULTISPECIES: FAD-binding oxidoreductase [Ramlibacter]|uniref:FAD-binding oxidoreductase n=1 Tax=Ramlibacter aquaticus TaxID=2780094 RepID=A0ABR9SIM6_9BURK|nr:MULTISPECIES: FAD-binding oxidoreductase [Ramlibacter]MBE7942219.1 FAD-binding oxidoreductase [Ramlibacter aquaticus]